MTQELLYDTRVAKFAIFLLLIVLSLFGCSRKATGSATAHKPQKTNLPPTTSLHTLMMRAGREAYLTYQDTMADDIKTYFADYDSVSAEDMLLFSGQEKYRQKFIVEPGIKVLQEQGVSNLADHIAKLKEKKEHGMINVGGSIGKINMFEFRSKPEYSYIMVDNWTNHSIEEREFIKSLYMVEDRLYPNSFDSVRCMVNEYREKNPTMPAGMNFFLNFHVELMRYYEQELIPSIRQERSKYASSDRAGNFSGFSGKSQRVDDRTADGLFEDYIAGGLSEEDARDYAEADAYEASMDTQIGEENWDRTKELMGLIFRTIEILLLAGLLIAAFI